MRRRQWQNQRRAVGAALQAGSPYVRADKRRNGDAVAFCVASVGEGKRKRPFTSAAIFWSRAIGGHPTREGARAKRGVPSVSLGRSGKNGCGGLGP